MKGLDMSRTSSIVRATAAVFQLTTGAKLMRLRLDDPKIRRHPIAQRGKRNRKHVNAIKGNYNPMLDLPIVISYSNGWKNIVDGDHRFTARLEMFKDGIGSPYIDAIVYFGLTRTQDHALFYGFNQKKKQLDSQSKWFNGYHGKEPHIVGAINLIAKLGFTCSIGPKDDTSMVTKHNEYDWRGDKCIGTLISLYEKWASETEQWLHGIRAWRLKNGSLHPDTMSVELLRGTFQFVKRHCADLTNDQIRQLFARTDPAKVRAAATRLQIEKGRCRGDAQYVEAFARVTQCYRKTGKVVVNI
jgi:hypothetical protein